MKGSLALSDLENRIRRVTGEGAHSLHVPRVEADSNSRVMRALQNSKVSVDLGLIGEVEQALMQLTNSKNCVATSSGTSALHLVLAALGVGPGDFVLCSAVSFVATANAVMYLGAVPVFVDVDQEDFGMSPNSLKNRLTKVKETLKTRTTGGSVKAVVATSVFGLPLKLAELRTIAAGAGLPLVLDGAGALGTTISGQSILTLADVAITSFNGNKIITAGSGGAVFTESQSLSDEIRHLSLVSKVPHDFEFLHDRLGYNYRLPALNAALLLDQLSGFTSIIEKKRALHDMYSAVFDTQDWWLVDEAPDASSNYWLNTIRIHAEELDAKAACQYLVKRGLAVRPLWTPLPRLTYFPTSEENTIFPVSDALASTSLSLPSSYFLVAT